MRSPIRGLLAQSVRIRTRRDILLRGINEPSILAPCLGNCIPVLVGTEIPGKTISSGTKGNALCFWQGDAKALIAQRHQHQYPAEPARLQFKLFRHTRKFG